MMTSRELRQEWDGQDEGDAVWFLTPLTPWYGAHSTTHH